MSDNLEFQLSQYLDGQLSKDEAAALEERLLAEPAAARLLEQYRRLDDQLHAMGEVGLDQAAQADQHRALMQSLERRALVGGWHAEVASRRPLKARFIQAAMAVAALILMAVVVWPTVSSLRDRPGSTASPQGPAVVHAEMVGPDKPQGPVHVSVERPPRTAGPMVVAYISPPPQPQLPQVPRGTVLVSVGLDDDIDLPWPMMVDIE
jgi:anti-sigma factor RsiW